MKTFNFKITGFRPLLLNNPQTADPLNEYSKLKKPITSKRVKTDDDFAELHDIDIRSKIYWDDDLHIYVPSTWVMAALGSVSHSVSKVSKAKMRGGVFMNEPKLKLTYRNMEQVKEPVDIVKNPEFRHKQILPQGNVRLPKVFPVFSDWSFEGSLDYDESVTTGRDLKLMLERAAKYGGFGDFRPSYGQALAECDF